MLDAELLNDFMHRFYGYGSWDAKLWFIGMEEGGGNDAGEIERRLGAWDRSGELADLLEYHRAIGGTNWFGNNAAVQSTWGKLIRIALAAEGRNTDIASVRRYQQDELGRHGGNTALIELLPLPSPSTGHWLYAGFGVKGLDSRDDYRRRMLPIRSKEIAKRIRTHAPRAVVFYGLAYREWWQAIAGKPFIKSESGRFEAVQRDSTLFVLAPHPVAFGVRNSDFEAIGGLIRS